MSSRRHANGPPETAPADQTPKNARPARHEERSAQAAVPPGTIGEAAAADTGAAPGLARSTGDDAARRTAQPRPAERLSPAAAAEIDFADADASATAADDTTPFDTTAFHTAAPVPDIKPVPLAQRLENLIGGKLPIWVGGISLIFAGFFLIRYGIEAGLLGPGVRAVLAALFGIALLAASEAGRVWSVLDEDKRLGQSLAGAGIAILYGALYMSGALYGLIGALTAFVLLVLVTLAALVLSLRRGPPTALMGLLGGFCAPYISGLGPDAAGPLLIYLAIFTAGLFALAIHRGWLWLALLASGGSVLWSSALMLLGVGNAAPLLGLFIVALAVAGTVALARIGEDYPQRDTTGPGLRGPLLRIAPIAAGLVQLAVFAPLIDFTLIGWLFYAALSAFALVMAWRDARLTPAAVGALLLVLVLLAGAIESGMDVRGVWWVAAVTASLFGLPGQWLAFRARDGGLWALLAAGAPAGAFAVLFFGLPSAILSPLGWGLLAVVAALPAGLLAWRASRAHIETADPDEPAARYWWSAGPVFPLRLGTATAAALALVPAITWAPDTLEAAALLLIPLAMLGWQRHVGGTALRHMEIVPLLIGLLALGDAFEPFAEIFARSLAGYTAHYGLLPPLLLTVPQLLLPGALLALIWWLQQRGERAVTDTNNLRAQALRGSSLAAAFAAAAALAFLYTLAKQPLAIASDAQFVRQGFGERAVLTQLLIVAAWLVWQPGKIGLTRFKNLPALRIAGHALLACAALRVLWFDGLVLNPLWVAQRVGPLPLVNLLTLHLAALALWAWLFARMADTLALQRMRMAAALAFTLLAALAVVRQAMTGSIVTGPVGTTENYLYSAVMIVLAALWLWRGMAARSPLLRVAGLLLLTLVTLKVFLLDAAALEGLLRILSFLGLGVALLGLGWVYGRVMGRQAKETSP